MVDGIVHRIRARRTFSERRHPVRTQRVIGSEKQVTRMVQRTLGEAVLPTAQAAFDAIGNGANAEPLLCMADRYPPDSNPKRSGVVHWLAYKTELYTIPAAKIVPYNPVKS